MKRSDWDSKFKELSDEADRQERRAELTSAAIAGRLSVVMAAAKAVKEGLTFEQFINVMNHIVVEEITAGKIDESTFQIPKDIADFNDQLPEV